MFFLRKIINYFRFYLLPVKNQIFISPQIYNDYFYELIAQYVALDDVHTVLEIGSSSGEGSTKAIFESIIKHNKSENTTVYCFEVIKERYQSLVNLYKDYNFIKPYNYSSVSINDYPSDQDVMEFINSNFTILNQYPLKQVLKWLNDEKKYISENKIILNGIDLIKKLINKSFDLVLIDGSEFTGFAELQKCLGAKYIFLDDINSYKNYNSYQTLDKHIAYTLIYEDKNLRNGFALFGKLID